MPFMGLLVGKPFMPMGFIMPIMGFMAMLPLLMDIFGIMGIPLGIALAIPLGIPLGIAFAGIFLRALPSAAGSPARGYWRVSAVGAIAVLSGCALLWGLWAL